MTGTTTIRQTKLSQNKPGRSRIAILEILERNGQHYVLRKIGPDAANLAESWKTPSTGVDRTAALVTFQTEIDQLAQQGFVVDEDRNDTVATSATKMMSEGFGEAVGPAEAARLLSSSLWYVVQVDSGATIALITYDAPSGQIIVTGSTSANLFDAIRDGADAAQDVPSFTVVAASKNGDVELLDLVSIEPHVFPVEALGYDQRREILEGFAEELGLRVAPKASPQPGTDDVSLLFFLRRRAYDKSARAILRFTGAILSGELDHFQPNWTGSFKISKDGSSALIAAPLPLDKRVSIGYSLGILASGDAAAVLAGAS